MKIRMDDEEWNKSKYFKKKEFKCGCNGRYCKGYPSEISKSLIDNLNTIRSNLGKPVIITSGLRCSGFNTSIGGYYQSKHMSGEAADFNCGYVFSKSEKDQIVQMAYSLPNTNYSYTNDTNMSNAVHIDTKRYEDIPAPNPDLDGEIIYTVKSGDNLTTIAKNFNTTVDEILILNPDIKDKNLIYVNQKIKIPTTNSNLKPISEVAKEVIRGDWGNGKERKDRLEQAGYNYSEVQKEVNKMLE